MQTVANPDFNIKAYIAGLMNDATSADFSIICRDGRIGVHRIVMMRFPYFRQYFQENPTALGLQIDADASTARILLRLAYCDEFSFPKDIATPDFINLVQLLDQWQLPQVYRFAMIQHAHKMEPAKMLDGYPHLGLVLANLFDRESDRQCQISHSFYRYGYQTEIRPWNNQVYRGHICRYYVDHPELVTLDMVDWPIFREFDCECMRITVVFQNGAYNRLNQFKHHGHIAHGHIARLIRDTKQDLSSFLTPLQRRAFVTSKAFGAMPKTGIPLIETSSLMISSYVPFSAVQYVEIGAVTGKDSRITSFTIRLTAPLATGAKFVFAYKAQGSNINEMRAGRVVAIRSFKMVEDEIKPYGDAQLVGIEGSDYCIEFEPGTQMPYKGTKIFTVHTV